jgi:hypothetical protein
MTDVGYHSLGGIGSESVSGSPDDPHYGGVSELRVKGDIAAVGLLSSKSPTLDRGIAILDVSAYTRAESREELERAEMSVLSFVPNENNTTSVMDVKFSGDGSYLFAAQQPVAGLFAATAGQVPEGRTEGESAANAEQAGLLAIDISTPGDPDIVGRVEYGFGMHNCYHHRINGEDYVFGVTGPLGEPAGVYAHRLDRSTGGMERVNFWTFNTEVRQGEFGNPAAYANATDNEYYAHDVTVIDDPVTGDPYAYLANWGTSHDAGESGSGARVLNVSDPTDIEELGVFTMERAHTIEPLRRTLDGKRLFVVGQENPDPDPDTGDGSEEYGNETGHTGFYYLVDATGVENGEELGTASIDTETSAAGDELAKWVWRENAAFDAFTYSAHNIDTFRTEIDGDTRAFVTTGHYHAGTRILEIGHPSGPAVEEEDRTPADAPYDGELENGASEPVSEGAIHRGRAAGRWPRRPGRGPTSRRPKTRSSRHSPRRRRTGGARSRRTVSSSPPTSPPASTRCAWRTRRPRSVPERSSTRRSTSSTTAPCSPAGRRTGSTSTSPPRRPPRSDSICRSSGTPSQATTTPSGRPGTTPSSSSPTRSTGTRSGRCSSRCRRPRPGPPTPSVRRRSPPTSARRRTSRSGPRSRRRRTGTLWPG